jgi:fucose 4-O-acetylase-like acetyltransferase
MNNNIQFDNSVSFAKGIGIMLMVLGHTFFSAYGYAVIYMFHMPLFFFLSGYCFRVSHLEDFRNYAKKRVNRIYIPFVKWALIFLLLHNIFFHLNIYNDSFGFEGEVSQLYGLSDYLKKTFLIFFCLSGNEQLLGGYWFLHTMFFASFIFYGLLKLKMPIVGGLIALLLSVLLYFKGIPVVNIYSGAKEFFAVSCMMAGYLYKSYSMDKFVDDYSVYVLPVCALLLVFGSLYWHGDMLDMSWIHTVPYFISAIAGSIIVMKLSKWFVDKTRWFSNLITNIGNKTIEILTWHFLCFKIVSMIIIAYDGLPIEHLAEFPVMRPYNTQGWWICYFIIGVAVPVIGAVYFNKLSQFISSKYHSLCR